MKNISAVIFDFDGTLTPLTLNFSDLRAEVEALAQQYVDTPVINNLSHLYVVEMIYELERLLGHAGAEFRRRAFERLAVLETEGARDKELYGYTREVLGRLRARGIKVAIITRNCADAVRIVFPDMDVYVDSVVTRDDVDRVKPHPNHVAKVLSTLGVNAEEAIMVGDHPTDIQAGRALGVRTVAVLTGRTQEDEFEKAGAHYIVKDIRGLEEYV